MLFISLLSNSLAKLGDIQLSLLNCSLVKIFSLSLSKSCGALQCGGYLRNIALLKLVLLQWHSQKRIYWFQQNVGNFSVQHKNFTSWIFHHCIEFATICTVKFLLRLAGFCETLVVNSEFIKILVADSQQTIFVSTKRWGIPLICTRVSPVGY